MTGAPSSRAPAPDVVVVGGGIVGASAAAYLAAAGAAVTLVESEAIGAGASGRNSGVVQHPFDGVLTGLHLATVEAYRELTLDPGLGFRIGPAPAGLLLVSLGADGARRIAAELAAAWPEFEPEYLDPASLHAAEPGLAPGLSACRVRIGYPVPPAAATRAFAALADRRGVRAAIGLRVVELSRSGDRVTGVRLGDGSSIPAGAVLIAAGPASPELIDPTGRWRPIRSVWGVVVDIGLADPPRHVLEEAEMDDALGDVAAAHEPVAEPAEDDGADASGDRPEFSLVTAAGRSSLGSTFLERAPDPSDWIPRLVAHGRRFVPAIADASIGAVRVCARPVSVDGRPLIGPIPGRTGLYVVAGHGPWGISTGPGSARLGVEAILGSAMSIPAELAAGRFGPVD